MCSRATSGVEILRVVMTGVPMVVFMVGLRGVTIALLLSAALTGCLSCCHSHCCHRCSCGSCRIENDAVAMFNSDHDGTPLGPRVER